MEIGKLLKRVQFPFYTHGHMFQLLILQTLSRIILDQN